MDNSQISLDYQEAIVCSCCFSHWSDHQTEKSTDLQCLDPESPELMRHNQQLLLFIFLMIKSESNQFWGKLLLKVMHYNIALLPKKVTNFVT